MHQSTQRAPSVSNCVQYEYVWLVRVLLYGGAEYCVLVERGVSKIHLCHPGHCAKVLKTSSSLAAPGNRSCSLVRGILLGVKSLLKSFLVVEE